MQDKSLMFYMIRSELEDAVGVENVSTKEIERAVYSVDYFWLSRKWQDAGEQGPMPDIIVRPGTTEEVSKVMKIANYYKIPSPHGAAAPEVRAALCRWPAAFCWTSSGWTSSSS